MAITAGQIEEAMLALDRRDLAALIHRGIQAPDEGDVTASQDEIDAAWRDEVARRIDDVQSGRVETLPLDESFSRIRAKLATRRR